MSKVSKHTIHLHIEEDRLYYAMLRLKAEFGIRYGCRTWEDFMYKLVNLPVQSQLSQKDQERVERIQEVLGKSRDYGISRKSELFQAGQAKLQTLESGTCNAPQRITREELDEIIAKRDAMLEELTSEKYTNMEEDEFMKYLGLLDIANQHN